MPENTSTALVPYSTGGIAPAHRTVATDVGTRLVREDISLHSREDVCKFLPDILGRALARIWIDPAFYADFGADPKACLERAGVHLPETISIEFSKANADRPKIVVYETATGSRFKKRILYLQLVMMAGI
jgi:hypothetical protein